MDSRGFAHPFLLAPNSLGLIGSSPYCSQLVYSGTTVAASGFANSISYIPSLTGGTNLVNATAPQMATSMCSSDSCIRDVSAVVTGNVTFQSSGFSLSNATGPTSFVIQTANGQLLSTGFGPTTGSFLQPYQVCILKYA